MAIACLCCSSYKGFSQNSYHYTADLINIADDQVSVSLRTPVIADETAIFSFPKAIPGSYAVKDFGRFIKEFKAFDKSGKKLPVQKLNSDQYKISKATRLARIDYKVNDTWDTHYSNYVFQPGGSNIEAGKNVVMNNHAFYGYLENYQALPFTINVFKPADFFASTNLKVTRQSPGEDLVEAKNYNFLADNPILYCVPDTTSFVQGNTTINVSVYSATGKIKSNRIAEYLKPLSAALEKFFSGLPVKNYQFLFYFEDPDKALATTGDGGYGALEHNYSSFYFLPEIGMESRLHSLVNEVAGHEFLHIQTPLNLHSEEIEHFNFIEPQMSQHLWLYEGVTEYFAHLVQVQNGLIDQAAFFRNMQEKMKQAEEFGNFSMTEMSKNVLTEQYKSKYNSVYSKGALTAFILDLFIRQQTNNGKDLKTVIQTLSAKYGPDKPFEDDKLFDAIIDASHPLVKTFIDNYIKGDQPLPLKELFATIGYSYEEKAIKSSFYIGQKLSLAYDEPTSKFVFKNVGNNALVIKDNDVLVVVDSVAVTENNLNDLWEKYFQANYTEPILKVTVERDGVERTLEGKLFRGQAEIKNYLAPMEAATDAQKLNLNHLLNGN